MGNINQLGQVRNISEEILADVNLAIAKFNSGTVTFGGSGKSKDDYAYIASIEGCNYDKGNIILTTVADECSFTVKSSEELGYSIEHNMPQFTNMVVKFNSEQEFSKLSAMDILDIVARYCLKTNMEVSYKYVCQVAESTESIMRASLKCSDHFR